LHTCSGVSLVKANCPAAVKRATDAWQPADCERSSVLFLH
jgi:hypothetical protein